MMLFQKIRNKLGLSDEEYPMREQDMKAMLTKQLRQCMTGTCISKFTGAIHDGTSTIEYAFVLVPGTPLVVCTFSRGALAWHERLSVGRISDWIVRNKGYLDLMQQIRQALATGDTVFTPEITGDK